NKGERILRTEHDGTGNAVPCQTDGADEDAVLVKRNAAGRTIERRSENRDDRQPGRWAESDEAARRAEFVDVGGKEVRKPDTDERTWRGVTHARREMLLNDKPGGAGRERVLVAAQICGRARFRNAAGNIE